MAEDVADGIKVDSGIEYVEAWVCDQPPRDARYRVLRDEWIEQPTNLDHPIRLIFEIRLADG